MSTANNVELLVITIILGLAFLLVIFLLVEAILAVHLVRAVIRRAEKVLTSVEAASDTIKHITKAKNTRWPLLHLIHELYMAANRHKNS